MLSSGKNYEHFSGYKIFQLLAQVSEYNVIKVKLRAEWEYLENWVALDPLLIDHVF